MDGIRNLVESIGLQPEHFDIMIGVVIVVGGIWAVRRLYGDLTGPPIEYEIEETEEKG